MSKDLFGAWGRDADEYTFGAALAGIGIAAAVAPERVAGTKNEVTAWWAEYGEGRSDVEPYPWQSPLGLPSWDTVDAETWSALWYDRPTGWDHLAVDRDLGSIDEVWLTEVLGGAGGEASVYFPNEASMETLSQWRFPLRIGLIDAAGGVEIGLQLESAAADDEWVETLITPLHLNSETVSADIVLAVGSPEEIGVALDRVREVRGDSLIAFYDDCTLEVLDRLQAGQHAPVVAAVDDARPAEWLIRFVRHLSRDEPFDIALKHASTMRGIVTGPTVFMSEQRPSRRASALAETLRSIETGGKRSTRSFNAAATAADFEDATQAAFATETGDATALVEMEQRASPLIAGAAGARWLQAQITDRAEPERPLGEFRTGTDHEIRVRIAPRDAEWLEAAAPFPEDQLPLDQPSRLTVVLTEPTLLEQPLVEELVLPVTGASSDCVFTLTTGPHSTSVDARLIVLSRNRVLQSARLPEAVAAASEAGRRSLQRVPRQVATPETVVRGAGGNLAERRTFDAAFVVNHDEDGAAGATAVADGQAATIELDDTTITEALEKLTGRLGEIVDQPEDFETLDAEGSRELLVFLAHHGALLRRALVKDFLGETLGAATYLQVVSARPDAYFPFELAYDFTAPGEDATLCPDAAAALEDHDVTAGCPGTHDRDTVCPFGFWAISKVIERHAFQPGIEVPKSFLVRSQPRRDRNTISLSDEALVAVSDRVDNFAAGSAQRLVDSVESASGNVGRPVTWKDWNTDVAKGSSSLLMLLPHTVHSDPLDTFGLEIGSGDRAWAADINEKYLPPADRPVIVALLGCETATTSRVGYERFPGILRRAGAEVVVATLTEVLGRHAAPVGARLAEALYACCEDRPRSVGEVMVGLRRQLLSEGMMMVLALAVFGDADWLLERRH